MGIFLKNPILLHLYLVVIFQFCYCVKVATCGKNGNLVGTSGQLCLTRSCFGFEKELQLMFIGEWYHTIDSKGRITVPSRLRELLPDGGYLTRGFDRNLLLYRRTDFERLTNRVQQLTSTKPENRLLFRHLFSGAVTAQFDKIGRVVVPNYLRDYARLTGEVTLAGAGNYLEIWAGAEWAASAEQRANSEMNAQQFAFIDLAFTSAGSATDGSPDIGPAPRA